MPHLAESWSISEDRLKLTFKLRTDVKFHSGRAFTADDAKWCIDYALDPKTAVTAAAGLKGVQASARDSSTLELSLPTPLPELFGLLMYVFMIDSQSDVTRTPGGTGPFRLDGLDPSTELRLVRNTSYWRAGQPFLDGVTIRTISDAPALITELESGGVMAAFSPTADAVRLQATGQFTIASEVTDGNYCYLINSADPPFNDARVRQAVNLAIDRQRLCGTLLNGLSAPTYVMWPHNSPAYDPAQDVGEFNLDKARQLLAAAGYGSGFETVIQSTSSQLPDFFRFNEVLQADLASIGIKATIQNLELQEYTLTRNQGKFPGLFQHSYAYADSDPAMAFTAVVFRPVDNVTRFRSEQYSDMISTAHAETDPTRRIADYRKIAEFVKDQAFLLPVTNPVAPFALRSNVHGFRHLPGGSALAPVYEDIWLA